MNQGIFQSDPFLLKYDRRGQGRPCLVIGSATYYPRTFSENLCQHLQMTHIDTRAFAATTRQVKPNEKKLEEVLKDIENIRIHLNIEKPIVIGHSGNAYIALEYAKKYSNHVSQLVLLNTGPDLGLKSQQAAEANWQENAGFKRKQKMQSNLQEAKPFIPGKMSAEAFIDFYVMNTPKTWFDYNYNARALWDGVTINMPVFEYLWAEVFSEIDIAKNIDKITMPVFLGLGDHDFIVAPYANWKPWLKMFKNIHVKVFSNCGHTPQLECPEAFDDALLKWIAK
jgi:proline iminopeptidase